MGNKSSAPFESVEVAQGELGDAACGALQAHFAALCGAGSQEAVEGLRLGRAQFVAIGARFFSDYAEAVMDRLFGVMASVGEKDAKRGSVSFEQFLLTAHVLSAQDEAAGRERGYRLLFRMFDPERAGHVELKELTAACLAVATTSGATLAARSDAQCAAAVADPIEGLEDLGRAMARMVMVQYDTDTDNRLSLREWLSYCHDEEGFGVLLSRLSAVFHAGGSS